MTPYWKERAALRYPREVVRLAREHAPAGGSVIDVGSRDCEYILWLDWFEHKTVLDIERFTPPEGVERITADFRDFELPRRYDLVLCLQVLEHLDDPARFMRKLLSTGTVLIASVPFEWPKGVCRWHVQDPVDHAKLAAWAGREPTLAPSSPTTVVSA